MQKDASYYESTIRYNEEFARLADELAETIEHETVQGWCRSIAKQHKFHAGRHKKVLSKIREQEENEKMTEDTTPDENGLTKEDIANLNSASEGLVVTTFDGQSAEEFDEASKPESDYRDAGTGEFVTKEYAAEHPDTTVHETQPGTAAQPVSSEPDPELAAQPVEAAPNPEQAAQPVDAGVGTEMTEAEAQEAFARAQADAEAAHKKEASE